MRLILLYSPRCCTAPEISAKPNQLQLLQHPCYTCYNSGEVRGCQMYGRESLQVRNARVGPVLQ